jgi:site-specific DNA-methyltransferase (adenine-specific)
METFSKEDHTIIWSDAVEALKNVPDRSVDLIVCDPPHNIGKNFNGQKDEWVSEEKYLEWCYEWITLCIDKLKGNGSLYLMAAAQSMPFLDIFVSKRMIVLSRIIWHYDSSGVQAKYCFGSLYEPILHCIKQVNYTFNAKDILLQAKTGATRKLIDYRKSIPVRYSTMKVLGNVWTIPRVRYRMPEYEEHPTQKPVALLERIVLVSSNPGDLVLDPFAGTFTASFVAKKHGRRSLGIEIEEAYVKIGLRRLDIASEYKGEPLCRPPKTHEKTSSEKE